MKTLTNKEMANVEGGFSLESIFSNLFGSGMSKSSNPTKAIDDPFIKNIKKMFGASTGRDLAKLAQKYKLTEVVNSIFGW